MDDKPAHRKRKVWGYIFFDKKTPYKPEVLKIAQKCGLSRREVFAILLEFWVWVDDNCPSGVIPGADVRFLSQICPATVPEFWNAVASVGWLIIHDDSVEIPNFDRWLGNTAKRRAMESMRKQDYRQTLTEDGTNVGQTWDKRGTSVGTRGGPKAPKSKSKSKSINTPLPPAEEAAKMPPIPPALDTAEFRKMWEMWIGHRAAKKSKLTPHAAQLQLTDMAEWGLPRALAALKFSITKGWTGLFEEEKHGGFKAGHMGPDSRVRAEPGKYDNIGVTRGQTAPQPKPESSVPPGNQKDAQRDRDLFEGGPP